jgi:hypothetical protein
MDEGRLNNGDCCIRTSWIPTGTSRDVTPYL